MTSFLLTSLLSLFGLAAGSVNVVANVLSAQYTNVSHIPLSAFEADKDLTIESLDGKRKVFCFFPADELLIQEILARAHEAGNGEMFVEDAIILTISGPKSIFLTVNAYSQVRDREGNVFRIQAENDRNLYSFLAGVAFANSCFLNN